MSSESARIVGREQELAALRAFVTAAAPARALVLTGGPGIGKTTLWEAAIGHAREHGARILVARPTGGETGLSFAALVDLFSGVEVGALPGLPPPQRSALEVALLRVEPAGAPAEPQAIALGVLNALRALAAEQPLVLAVDDLQWLDPPSADALVFALRRLADEPVVLLATKRPGRPTALEQALGRDRLERLEVAPLSLGATRRLLAERLGLSLPRPLLRRIVATTLGNPFFALEVGRTVIEHGIPSAGEDLPLPDAVEDLLGTRLGGMDPDVRRLLLAVSLTDHIERDEVAAVATPATLEDAVDAGLLQTEDGRVRVSHPLLAAAAKKHARPREKRELHRALAAVVDDDECRALHAALAAEGRDEELAATLSATARVAAARGDRQQAVRLGEHALRLTPPGTPEHDERLLDLAASLDHAGQLQRLTQLLAPVVESLPAGRTRARGWLLLSEGAGPQTVPELLEHLERVLAESRDEPDLHAYALAEKAATTAASTIARLPEAEVWAQEALELAATSAPDVERLALYALGWPRALTGRALDDLCERSGATADAGSYLAAAPERVAGQRHVWRGEIAQARAILTRMLALADERGEPASYALQRLHLCELELRVGEWDAAERRLDEWEQSSEKELLIRPMYQRCRALLAAGVGRAADTDRWARNAAARAEEIGSRWDWLEAMRAHGMAALLAGEPAAAVERLRPAWRHTEHEGVGDPGAFPIAPELVEALADVGEHDEALAVTGWLEALAERHDHPWGRVTAKRCHALVGLASSGAGAAEALAEAATTYGTLGLAFERARTLLTLGRGQRRLKQWGGAREALETAVAAFDDLGSTGWAEVAGAELSRVGGRRPRASGELTPTERHIVELAADGLANKEIALALHLAVHTVEVHLSRAYAKLGVRSRSQLAARLRASSPA